MSYSSCVTIVEQLSTTSSGAKPRVAILNGPAMPFMGAAWSGELHLTTTWYPGNGDEATQQVLGPRDMPSAWQGEWRRSMMDRTPSVLTDAEGNTQQVVDPDLLRDFLEDLFRGGRRLKVVWSTEQSPDARSRVGSDQVTVDRTPIAKSGQIVRVGRAKTWNFRHHDIFNIEWDITFEWLGRGATTPKATSTRSDTVQGLSAAYLSKLQALVDANQFAADAKNHPAHLTLGQIEQLADAPSKISARSARIGLQLKSEMQRLQALSAKVGQPFQVTHAAVRHARSTQLQTDAVYRELSARPAETLTTQRGVAAMLRAFVLFARVQDSATDASAAAYFFGQKLRKGIVTFSPALTGERVADQNPSPEAILAMYTVKDGDTPQKISQRFYGTPDHAADVLRANRFSWHTIVLPRGKNIIIPQLASVRQFA